jgi:TolB-like protein
MRWLLKVIHGREEIMVTAYAPKQLPDSGTPTVEEVQSYLRELFRRDGFCVSERCRRFLSYVVQETLEGRADRIKAYNIALAAFDRTGDFDPLTDPIVRIEAGRVRRALEHYYLTAGQADRIRIDIPKGAYAATFCYRGDAARVPSPVPSIREIPVSSPRYLAARSFSMIRLAAVMVGIGVITGSLGTYGITSHANQAAIADHRPSLLILPFEDTGEDSGRAFVARGLTFDVGMALAQLSDVAVFAPGPALEDGAAPSRRVSDFTIMGSVQTHQNGMRVAVLLTDSRTGQILQSWLFRKNFATSDVISAQAEVAHEILASLREQCARVSRTSTADTAGGTFDCSPVEVAANHNAE